ncbi:MAG: RtcB family protein, partial [Deferribacterales bacterium]
MVIIKGKYNEAIVFTDNIESSAYEQIKELCNQEFVKGSKIRIMPDVHAGAGCVIGTTMTVKDKVVPNLVGVDIGCGIDCIKLKNKDIDLVKLDSFIKRNIPHGTDVHKNKIKTRKDINLSELTCKKHVDIERGYLSIGSLGGGNHFIEIDRDQEGNLYLL